MIDIPEALLKELRYQHLTKFRFSLYKRPEFPFLQSVGVNDLFQAFTDKEYGYIGTVRLKYDSESKAWIEEWYEKMEDIIAIAELIQKNKQEHCFTDENKIIDAHINYMNRFILKLDDSIVYS